MTENSDRLTAEAKGILESISAVAAKRRREAAPALERSMPEWLLEIRQTEVVYTLNPRMIPLAVTSFPVLHALLKERYSLGFGQPDLGPIPVKSELSEAEIGQALLRSKKRVRFENGRFSRSPVDFDIIRSVNIDFESIHVVVGGVSEVAELVVADVAEMLWAAAGAEKRWDQLETEVQLVGYATATMIDLGISFEEFLSPQLLEFINSDVLSGSRYAHETGRKSARLQFELAPTLQATWGLDDLRLKFFLFDTATGRYETTRMDFSVLTRDTVGTGRVMVYSELPFQKHLECLEALRAACG